MSVPVSAVIPAHNRADVVGRAVRSVLSQRIAPAEVIVVDDGSTDGTAAAASRAGARVVSSPERRGAGAARNAGVEAARSDWVAFLDSDDEWLPHLLQTLWPLREGHAIVAGSAVSHWDGNGRPDRFAGLATRRPVVIDSPATLVPDNVIAISGALVDRRLMLKLGGCDTRLRYAEDWDLWMRMLEHGSAILSPRVVCVYHRHDSQKSSHAVGPRDDHAEILRACARRPWWSDSLAERRRAIRMWDDLTDGLAAGERRHALPLLFGLVARPVRLRSVAALLVRRRRVRRESRRLRERGPIAYITTHYPAVSHTFISREVAALRRRGVEVATTSVRRTATSQLLSDADRVEFEATEALLPARLGVWLRAHVHALALHPRAAARTLHRALSMGRPGARGRLWQLFYYGEAITAWARWRSLGVRHVHAHHAAVPADVAMLATSFGRLAGAGPGGWSFTLHGPAELWDVSWFGLAGKARDANAVVCISDFARSQLMALVPEEQWGKLSVVHCGVGPAAYEGCAPAPDGPLRIVCVGRLVPEKGQAVLLRAVAELAARDIDVSLELVGDGPERGALERLASDLGLGGRVRFAGAVGRDVVAEHLNAANVFCLPSFSEGVPVVLMEAMASRRPVVATAIAGVGELVRDGDSGLIVSPGRADELADALARLAEDPGMRERLADAGRARVVADYDIDRSAASLQRLFEGLVR